PDVQARWSEIEQALEKKGVHPMVVSAATGQNTRQVLYRAAQLLAEAPPAPPVVELPVYRAEDDPQAFTLEPTPQGWQVHGQAIERAAAMTYWEYDQSVRRFQRILESLGIDAALREAGVQPGDTVFIGEYELEWQE
ncbi:MAG: Obg family GTPase CgtA, partial [Anaerolineales bacterium]